MTKLVVLKLRPDLLLRGLSKVRQAATRLIRSPTRPTGDVEGEEEAFGLLLQVRFYICLERVSDEIGAHFRHASEEEAPICDSWGDPPPLCAIPATKLPTLPHFPLHCPSSLPHYPKPHLNPPPAPPQPFPKPTTPQGREGQRQPTREDLGEVERAVAVMAREGGGRIAMCGSKGRGRRVVAKGSRRAVASDDVFCDYGGCVGLGIREGRGSMVRGNGGEGLKVGWQRWTRWYQGWLGDGGSGVVALDGI
ncbi:hypothetical protein Acr_11g0010940 [Actinidia rufa]|uniref:Uncharacterized protein n=1 Tax=Actinidia rufa TaxID=165716 RepID=A0A7J0FDP7_9ERIC|nr:hypothetical protein Acr_11g0010940 [Actinidia rufa]